MALAEGSPAPLVSVFDTAHEDRVGQPLVDERPVRPQVTHDSTASGGEKVARAYSSARGPRPESVLPALRGSFGREYHYAPETETTQRMLPEDAAHGAVALAEHQTAGRGRLGRTWVDSGAHVLRRALPAGRRSPLAGADARRGRAVAGAVGPGATIKHPNDVLLDGRKVAGILAEASERVVLGIGINVGSAAWPGAGFVDRDRLELLVDVLERLEHGYDEWLATPLTVALDVARRVLRLRRHARHAALERHRERPFRLGGDELRVAVDEHRHGRRLVEREASASSGSTSVSVGATVSIVTGTAICTSPSASVTVKTAT